MRRGGGLRVDLLREHVAAEGNSPVEGDGRKISTVTTFHLGPSLQRRDDARHGGADDVQQAEIKINGAYAAAFLRTFRAKIQELDDAREVFASGRVGNSGNIANLGRKRLPNARADQRAAVGDEELQ